MNLAGARPMLAATFLATLLVGCGEDNSKAREEPPPVEETVFADQVGAIRKTEAEAAEMEARKKDLDAKLEEAEGVNNEPPP